MLKEAIEHLIGVGQDAGNRSMVEKIAERLYWRHDHNLVMPPEYPRLQLRTLTAFVQFLARTDEGKKIQAMDARIVVSNAVHVELLGPPTEYGDRHEYAVVTHSGTHVTPIHWIPYEDFVIEAQVKFERAHDFDRMMAYLRGIQSTDSLTATDDGVSQSATIRRGMESLAPEKFENPVDLALRGFTFPEIVDVPPATYIMRMKAQGKDLKVALFPVSDRIVVDETVQRIRETLRVLLGVEAIDIPVL